MIPKKPIEEAKNSVWMVQGGGKPEEVRRPPKTKKEGGGVKNPLQ